MSLRKFTSITALILITALMICALSACGAPAVDKESAVESAPIASANTIATAIIQEVPIDYMAKLEPETIPLHYDFDLTLVDDYSVYLLLVCAKIDSAYAILTNYDQFPAMTNTAAVKKGSAFSRKGD